LIKGLVLTKLKPDKQRNKIRRFMMVKQGVAYWYSYRNNKIYHAPDTHAGFFIKNGELNLRNIRLFGIKTKELDIEIDKFDIWKTAEELKRFVIDNGYGIRFGINEEKMYFEAGKVTPEVINIIQNIVSRVIVPDKIVTIEDKKRMIRKPVDKFLGIKKNIRL
jgi:hypothetical protein